jgi:tetratricopeptide (TPR) repeat protein
MKYSTIAINKLIYKKKYAVLIFCLLVLFFISCKHNSSKTSEGVKSAVENLTPEIANLTLQINSNPKNPELYKKRAIAYLDLKKLDEALLDINRALSIDSSRSDYYAVRSDIYFSMGKITNCRSSLEKAIALSPEDKESLLKLAELHFYLKEYDNTFKLLDKVASIDKNDARVWFMRGITYKDMGDTARAIKSLMEAVQIDENYYDAYLYLGILHAARKNPLAVDFYKNALNVKPNSPEILYNLGLFYQETGNYDKAIQTYTMVTTQDLNPDDSQYLFLKHSFYNLGYVNLQYTHLYRQAIKYFTYAVSIDPMYVEAYYNRGYSYELLGDVINARKDYEKSLQLRPNYELAIQGLNRLDNIGK